MRQVQATRYGGPILSGAGQRTASHPHSIVADDGNEYVVKFLSDCTANRTLANEEVAGEIAEILGVSFPGLAHVNIENEMIAKSAELAGLHVVAGVYLGCRRLRHAFDLFKAPADLADKVSNLQDALGAIALDIYVWNTDRNNSGNLLVEPTSVPHIYQLYVIDHGHCFTGPTWTDAGLAAQAPSEYLLPTHPTLQACANRAGDGEAWVYGIEQFADASLFAIVDQIPTEWNFADVSRTAMKTYLHDRKAYARRDCRLRGVICR